MEDFDFLIIGSGFGGSVSAYRLSQKGYKVAVLEKGRRFASKDFPKTNWDVRKFLWAPFFKCFGIQKITPFRNVLVLSGVGVGGGSLVYANTLVKPKSLVFRDPAWANLEDWETALSPHYETAGKMLGATRNRFFSEGDEVLKQIGRDLGCEDTFSSVDVAVHFGPQDREIPDPYFSGEGPPRGGCNFCGGCMVGCRFNAKNTLDKNYLYLAEKLGAKVFPETEVTRVFPDSQGYRVETQNPTHWFARKKTFYKSKNVILAGGVMGSVKLLLENKYIHKTLPKVSDQIGRTVRTNGESLVGSTALRATTDFTRGLAITSAIQPDEITKIEIVRYSKGSDFMRLLAAPLVGAGSNLTRPIKALIQTVRFLPRYFRLWTHKDWAANTIILLVMQSVDNQISLGIRRAWWRLFQRGFGAVDTRQMKIDAYIPVAERAARSAALATDGVPLMSFSESFLNAPSTAHILGGARIASGPNEGVVGKDGKVFGYEGLFVIDGSVVPVNLGVNPSLTISALAEYMMAKIPQKTL